MLKKICVVILFTFSLYSCATFRANYFLISSTSDSEKADLLFKEGVRIYNSEVLENKRLDKLDEPVRFFNDAVEVYPEHTGAIEFLKEIEGYKDEVLKSSLNRARELKGKNSRSELENYRYVLSVTHALDIGEMTDELKELKKDISDSRKDLINTYRIRISALEARILKEEEFSPLLSLLRKSNLTIIQLDSIDRDNSNAINSRIRLKNYINGFTRRDIIHARNLINNKEFIKAELIVRQIEIRHRAISKDEIIHFKRLKYDLFYNWAVELYSQGKFQLATNIVALANEIDGSKEVLDLKSNLENGIRKSNFESTISDVLASVDYYINTEKPSKALWVVNSYINRFSRESSRSALKNKRDEIKTMVEKIYTEGVVLFEEEDYEGALNRLEIVWNYDQDFKKVQSYYTTSKNRYLALKGEI